MEESHKDKNKIYKVKKQYEDAVNEYIKAFEKKQGLTFEHWIVDDVGGIACFGCVFYFNFDDIRKDINENQPKGLIIDWLYDSLEDEKKTMNYNSYCMGLRYEYEHNTGVNEDDIT